MYKYELFGLRVLSDIKFEFNEVDFDEQDLCINLNDALNKEHVEQPMLEARVLKDNTYIYDVENVAVFRIPNAYTIDVYPYDNNYHRSELNLYLLGNVLSALMIKRNVYVLHGSSVAIGNQGIVFTGDGGAGKSSVARGFYEKGYALLSDDLSVVDSSGVILPGFPTQKLWLDTMKNYDIKQMNNPVYSRNNKYVIDVNNHQNRKETKLSMVFLIEQGDISEIKVEKLSRAESLEVLLKNTYSKEFLELVGHEQEQFYYMVRLATNIGIYRMTRPEKGFTINEQIAAILMLADDSDT